ncbi:cysteine protease, papain C1 family (plasmid) [Legionella adelaidensis]|uniref:Cysteine protease n=1 Tax=Legionella adelaidensis TaxID=45056 RepID=A0A0W0R150_9GAMM|nr:C1 family peptidase [Legionella adelaidensis]KTC64773.1 cysteine protease [Legionella adelaidensis]VEH81902.1 cysteine protease, papain C1 family [Legionella adelaidensis]
MKIARFVYVSLFAAGSVFAQDFQVVGKITHPLSVPVTKATSLKAQPLKRITLMKVQLSEQAQSAIKARTNSVKQAHTLLSAGKLPSKVQLGMGNVPVLDQGMHGTCATFANTAAVNATLNLGDYISQLCQLELGSFLENNGYIPSGWNGTLGKTVLSQMDSFGIVSKDQQEMYGCGGMTQYPVDSAELGEELSPQEFHKLSEPLSDKIGWSNILDVYQAFNDKVNIISVLQQVKESLNKEERVTFGVLLPDLELGVAGAVGSYHAQNDTWVLSDEIIRDLYQSMIQAGHEMVITGYDDNAIAVDKNGIQHRGLLTLRNSWGESIGDHGDFYMSYDYFKALVIEAQEIRSLQKDKDKDVEAVS